MLVEGIESKLAEIEIFHFFEGTRQDAVQGRSSFCQPVSPVRSRGYEGTSLILWRMKGS